MLFMLRFLFVILLRLWQLRLASTAPRPDGGPSDHGPLMGVGITADGLKIEKYRDVVNKYFKVLTPGNGKQNRKSTCAGSSKHTFCWKVKLINVVFGDPSCMYILANQLMIEMKLDHLQPQQGHFDFAAAFVILSFSFIPPCEILLH
jgi:hypothetical protein